MNLSNLKRKIQYDSTKAKKYKIKLLNTKTIHSNKRSMYFYENYLSKFSINKSPDNQ